MSWSQVILSSVMGFLGGVIGSIITVRSFNKDRKRQIEYEISEKFKSLTETIENSSIYLDQYVDEYGLIIDESEDLRKKHYDTIAEVGNFFENISYLYYRSTIGKYYTDPSIREAISSFRKKCQLKNFKTSSFDDLDGRRTWYHTWRYIDKYVERKRAWWHVIRAFIFG